MFKTIINADLGIVSLSPLVVLFNLLLAVALSLIIAYVYKKTHNSLSYSQTFVATLAIAGVVIAAIMMVIGGSVARAFGAFGAFSLIRFRTAIKDAKDMGYIFLVLAVGMAVGTDNYFIAVATTIIVLLLIIILYKINFGSIRKFDYVLSFLRDTKQADRSSYKSVFDKYLKENTLLNIKARHDGTILQLSFSARFLKPSDVEAFINELKLVDGISDINVISAKNDIEY